MQDDAARKKLEKLMSNLQTKWDFVALSKERIVEIERLLKLADKHEDDCHVEKFVRIKTSDERQAEMKLLNKVCKL